MSLNEVQITDSFTQDQKHESKSNKFVTIQPKHIAEILSSHGLDLVHLRSGIAKNPDRAAHQTTIARYRSSQEMKIGGLNLDIVFKIPHLYGSIEAFLGTYRRVCSNGMVVGDKFMNIPRIRHSGNAISQIESIIPLLVAKHDQLCELITAMSAQQVDPVRLAAFLKEVARLRLDTLGENSKVISVKYNDLAVVRRTEDTGTDVFSILNVVQENIMRHGMSYQIESKNKNGDVSVRSMTTRPMIKTRRENEIETIRSVNMNASIWDAAQNILMAA